MDKMDGKTMDIVAENVGKLKELFPEAFTEGKVDFEALKELLGTFVDDRDERYSFTWNGKSKARMIAQTPSTGTLRPSKEESVDWDTTQNIFIEGDNLEVLKLLQKSYHKKVKMIYIDPPYNTGKDFVYKDNFKDNIKNYKEITGQVDGEGRNLSNNPETSGRYHTDWLNMMYPRLKLARNLLKDDGVIFISIDDNEVSNLRKICDEVFGEENCIGTISRATGTRMGSGSRGIARELDYLLIYSKTDTTLLRKLPMTSEELSIYNQEDERGKYLTRSLRRTGGENRREDRPSMFYPVLSPDGDEIFPFAPEGWESRWVCGKDTYEQLLADNFIEWKKVTKDGQERWQVYQKHYLNEDGKESSDLWTNEAGNKKGTRELNALFGGKKVFDHPKPIDVLKKIIDLGANKDEIVMDFFAGSGGIGQAVMELNVNASKNLKAILVQLPETIDDTEKKARQNRVAIEFLQSAGLPLTIAEISKERIRRAAAKIKEEKPEYEGDLGFKVFKLDSTNIKPWEVDFDLTERTLEDYISNIKSDRREEDVLYEILLKYGLDLTLPISERSIAGQKVFDIGMGALIICLADAISLKVVEGMAKL
ncbi:MAG: site-specific DNA-methyltransferase, partial [Candidatus Marinimicrobia bacterium]|nr:site-specific DNA-methyltransferase [Candidatus Neomarinimicrobiota bacterium]